jgi:alpha-N-arabinofuranosidase
MDDTDKMHLSLTNSDPVKGQSVRFEFRGITMGPSIKVSGKVLTSDNMTDHNTFDKPNLVTPREFTGAAMSGGILTVELPPKSVATVELA